MQGKKNRGHGVAALEPHPMSRGSPLEGVREERSPHHVRWESQSCPEGFHVLARHGIGLVPHLAGSWDRFPVTVGAEPPVLMVSAREAALRAPTVRAVVAVFTVVRLAEATDDGVAWFPVGIVHVLVSIS